MTPKPPHRDYALDFYRACLLAYIVCVIHPVYWLGNGVEPFKSLILFEMPLIFFVAGAAANLAGYRGKTFKEIFTGRVRRIMLPYLIYATLSLGAMALMCTAAGSGIPTTSLKEYTLSIIFGTNLPGVPYPWHLWFVPVYFIISISTPFQIWAINHFNGKRPVYIAICVCLWGGVYIISMLGILPHILSQLATQVFLYNIFYIIGLLLYKKLPQRRLGLLAVLSIILLAIITDGDITGMQNHKFNQDHIFLIFGTTALLILSYIASRLSPTGNPQKLFRCGLGRWNKHGYTIYLWQNWCFFILSGISSMTGIPATGSPLWLCWLTPALYLLSWALSLITVPIERGLASIATSPIVIRIKNR